MYWKPCYPNKQMNPHFWITTGGSNPDKGAPPALQISCLSLLKTDPMLIYIAFYEIDQGFSAN